MNFNERLNRLEAAIAAERPTCICEDGPVAFGEFIGDGKDCRMTCARCGGFWPEGWTFYFDMFSGKFLSIPPGEKFVDLLPSSGTLKPCRCEGRPSTHTEGPAWHPERFVICDECGFQLLPGAITSRHPKPVTAGSPAGE